ncbi:hypothetical protein ACH47C_40350 [Streptomyces rishiriensis]|uniref:hypothetical protein n=1 Tax=Streptomyces rishiriensis TaxID=68264 RepID=UPI0037ACC09A
MTWSVQVAIPLPGIVRSRTRAGESRESVRAVEGREIVADRGEELGARQRPDAGHAGHDVGQLMGPEPVLDEPVDLGDLLVRLRAKLDHARRAMRSHSGGGYGGWKGGEVTWKPPEPMLTVPVSVSNLRPGCAVEPKWDGFRALVSVYASQMVLRSRRGTEMGPSFPEVVAGIMQLPDATALDGVMWPVRVSQTQGASGGAPP